MLLIKHSQNKGIKVLVLIILMVYKKCKVQDKIDNIQHCLSTIIIIMRLLISLVRFQARIHSLINNHILLVLLIVIILVQRVGIRISKYITVLTQHKILLVIRRRLTLIHRNSYRNRNSKIILILVLKLTFKIQHKLSKDLKKM